MKPKDKNKQEFAGGFFVLLAPYTEENKNRTPKEALDDYFNRTEIETFFKIAKTYVGMLPICKESSDAIIGKIFSDVISTTFRIIIRENMSEKQKKIGIPKFIAQLQSLMCTYTKDENLTIATANKQAREVMKDFGIKMPSHLNLEEYKKTLLENNVSNKNAR